MRQNVSRASVCLRRASNPHMGYAMTGQDTHNGGFMRSANHGGRCCLVERRDRQRAFETGILLAEPDADGACRAVLLFGND